MNKLFEFINTLTLILCFLGSFSKNVLGKEYAGKNVYHDSLLEANIGEYCWHSEFVSVSGCAGNLILSVLFIHLRNGSIPSVHRKLCSIFARKCLKNTTLCLWSIQVQKRRQHLTNTVFLRSRA